MNFVAQVRIVARVSRVCGLLNLLVVIMIMLCAYLPGCSDQVSLPSARQLAEFTNAGPSGPAVDMDRIVRSRLSTGPYRVVRGDVLELTMPAILQVVTAEVPQTTEKFAPYVCRVGESGTIGLPIIGKVDAAGKTLAQLESSVIDAYHPGYIVARPAVVARVAEYRTAKVAITGAVQNPGIYELRSDQMSLVALLMQAGGIVDEGAARIHIVRASEAVADSEGTAIDQAEEPINLLLQRPKEYISRRPFDRTKAAEPDHISIVEHPAISGQIEEATIQLTFLQMAPLSTVGKLTIRRDDTTLLTEQLDIASEIQRKAMLERLAWKAPAVSVDEVGRSVSALAKMLRPGSVGSYGEDGGAVAHRNFAAKLDLGDSQQILNSAEVSRQDMLEVFKLEETPARRKQANTAGHRTSESLVLPVKGLNVPFADVALLEGDRVEVERLEPSVFTVVGLVERPGNFPYPSGVQYNLMQGLAFAGGLDKAADPRYASVYRLKADGTITSATFRVIEHSRLTAAASMPVKPGDIIDVAHTPRTRTNVFLREVFSVHVGAYVPVFDRRR